MRLNKATALFALPATTLAVTLSDFKSSSDTLNVANLPPECASVYTSNIAGCQASDFTGDQGCSQGCVSALDAMVDTVKSACGNEQLDGTSILTVFLTGDGPSAICPKTAAGSAPAVSSSSPSSLQQTTQATSTSITMSASSNSESVTTSTVQSQTTTTSSPSTTSAATSVLVVDTSSAARPSRTGNSQSGADDHSGQGSPFDTPGNYSGAVAAASLCFTSFAVTFAAILNAALR